MRLNNSIRTEVCRRILVDAFGAQHKALRAKIDDLANRAYRKQFDAQIQAANAIPREVADVMMKQWGGDVKLKIGGRDLKFLYSLGSLSTNSQAQVSYRYQFGEVLTQWSHPTYNISREAHGDYIFEEAAKLQDDLDDFMDAHLALKVQIMGVLNACYTTKKALELLPEAEAYLPKDDVPGTQALVSVDILNSVRAVLQQNLKDKAA